MLRINSISNVNNTLKNISFKAGVQTNYGVVESKNNLVEGSVLTGFVGIFRESPFFKQITSRADSIEKGLNETKLNVMA